MVTEEEAKAIVRKIAKPTLEFASTIVAPLYWAEPGLEGKVITRNGTAFFLQTPSAFFGVTAAHVIEGENGWRERCRILGPRPLRLGAKNGRSIELPWDARAVDIDTDIDIATFMISRREIEFIERVPYGGLQSSWPPETPVAGQGIIYSGFPGAGTRELSNHAVQFGVACGTGMASSVSETNISSLIERDHLEPVLGEGIMPENYNFGGISGAPMLYVFMKGELFLNALAGVIYSGPNTSDDVNEAIPGFELIRARPAKYLRADGFIDRDLWSSSVR